MAWDETLCHELTLAMLDEHGHNNQISMHIHVSNSARQKNDAGIRILRT